MLAEIFADYRNDEVALIVKTSEKVSIHPLGSKNVTRGGLITDDVLDALMAPNGIPSSLGQVTGLIGPKTNVYLVPGRDEAKGNTDDDVVLVRGMPGPPGPIL